MRHRSDVEEAVVLVQDLMSREPSTVTPGTSIKAALGRLADLGITSMPVVDGRHHVLGIVSEADLIREAVVPDPRAHERPLDDLADQVLPPRTVAEVCTRSTLCVRPHDDIAAAVTVMTATAVKSLPVVDEDHRLVGVLSRSDVVRALARPDEVIAADVDALLTELGHADWLVEVADGVVKVAGPSSHAERSLARVASSTVAGVAAVEVG